MFKKFFILFIVLSCFIIAQGEKEVLFSIPLTKLMDPIKSNGKETNRMTIRYALAEDFTVDKNDNIFLYNIRDFAIIKLNPKGKIITKINLKDFIKKEEVKNIDKNFNMVNLEIDKDDNLYCSIVYAINRCELLKFNNLGKLMKKYNLPSPFILGQRNTYYLSPLGHIHIYSFDYIYPNSTYIYDNSGKYLGKTEFDMNDMDGNYYFFRKNKTGAELTQYTNLQKESIAQMASSKKNETLLLNLGKRFKLHKNSWCYSGIDTLNRFYYASARGVIAQFDFTNKQSNIIEYSDLKDRGFFTLPSKIVTNFAGKIFIEAINYNPPDKEKMDYRNSQITFIKIN